MRVVLHPRLQAAVLFALFTLTVSPVSAQTFKELDAGNFCPGSGKTLKYALARALLDQRGVPASLIDWNDNGISYDQYARAVSVVLCDGTKDADARAAKCYAKGTSVGSDAVKAPSAGADKQAALLQYLGRAFEKGKALPPGGGFQNSSEGRDAFVHPDA